MRWNNDNLLIIHMCIIRKQLPLIINILLIINKLIIHIFNTYSFNGWQSLLNGSIIDDLEDIGFMGYLNTTSI